MAADWQPLVQFAMMHQQNLAVLDDEDRNSEINFLMDVRHGGRTVGRTTKFVKCGANVSLR